MMTHLTNRNDFNAIHFLQIYEITVIVSQNKMSPLNQNLFLFFEENEMQTVIDRKLVKLYMNRCIIDEDANFEISGVYELQKVSDLMFDRINPLFKTNANERTNKESVDRYIFGEALEKSSLQKTNSTDNHFIIGSSFHAIAVQKPTIINRIAKLLDWLLNEVKSQEIKSLYVTILAGARNNLITKEMHKEIYDGKRTHSMITPGAWDKPIPIPCPISVGDDFELSIKLIQHGRRLQQNTALFLQPMLDPYQLKLLEMKDETFLQSFTGHRIAKEVIGARADVSEEELKRFPDSDPSLRYVNCFCFRQSYHLKSP